MTIYTLWPGLYSLDGHCDTLHAAKTLVEYEGELVPAQSARGRMNGKGKEGRRRISIAKMVQVGFIC
jgi:hypothetical protein